mgnify:CR=1 FL=1
MSKLATFRFFIWSIIMDWNWLLWFIIQNSIVHYYSINDLKKDCDIDNTFIKLYKKFCPGPISFVLKLKKKSGISKIITNNSNSIAVRFPSHPLSRKLLKKINYHLAAPSANISTSISPVSKQDVIDEFGSKLKYILDGLSLIHIWRCRRAI